LKLHLIFFKDIKVVKNLYRVNALEIGILKGYKLSGSHFPKIEDKNPPFDLALWLWSDCIDW
jgi:hypothetical protein